MNHINNTLYLRRRNKIILSAPLAKPAEPVYLASLLSNLETLGFTLSKSLIEHAQKLSLEQLEAFYKSLDSDLRRAKGAHQQFKPMYPNFPKQVMKMNTAELYLNAILHYVTEGNYLPAVNEKKRAKLKYKGVLQIIDMGTEEEFEGLLRQIIGGNVAFSVQDKEDVGWFVQSYGVEVVRLLPETIPQKENIAFVAGLLIQHTEVGIEFLEKYCGTATDILRVTVAMSGGDVSLATATKFRSFTRPERKQLLLLLNRCSNLTEDMLRWKERWKRLGERLHPGEMTKKLPKVAEAFRILRNDVPVVTFNSQVEKALREKQVTDILKLLGSRPGEFARRLDNLLRLDISAQNAVLKAFQVAAKDVSTPVLLQVMTHFNFRKAEPLRVFFIKGNVAKAAAIEDNLPELADKTALKVMEICQEALIARFRELPALGKVYLDTNLKNFMVPFATRSSSKSFRTVARGSRLKLSQDCKVLRFFLWWKNGNGRTDIDLSAVCFDKDFCYKDMLSYQHLKADFGCHSGDIVDAPKGASEFIDISLKKLQDTGVRYVVMNLNSFTTQPYCDLPECFAGLMERSKPNSGEIYEPKTVRYRFDLTADTRIALPLIIDVLEREVIWCDLALKSHPGFANNVPNNLTGIHLTLRAMTMLHKTNLHDLLRLHAIARGELVEVASEADKVFSVENETPFHLEEIASEYMK